MDIEKIAQAIEVDAGMPLDELRQSLAEMQAGVGRVHTPEQILTAHTKKFAKNNVPIIAH